MKVAATMVVASALLGLGCHHQTPAPTKDERAESDAIQMMVDSRPPVMVARSAITKVGHAAPLHIFVPVGVERCYRTAVHPEREPLMSATAINRCKVRSLALFADGSIHAAAAGREPTASDPVLKGK